MSRKNVESDNVKQFRENMEAHVGQKPADYVSQWKPQIDSTVNSILNRKDFQYDVNADALYEQYKNQSMNLGKQAMMDTMGQATKLTGGYGNSNAQMVGQQAYQGYLQALTDKIPELAQLAHQMHNQKTQDLYQQYGLLNAQDQAAYDRWNADYNRWLTERDYLSNRYDTERGYDYGVYRDTVGDDQWKAKFDEDIRRFDFQNKIGEFAPVPGTVVESSGNRGSSTYTTVDNMLQDGTYTDLDRVQLINGSGLSATQKADLIDKYVGRPKGESQSHRRQEK